MAVSLRKIEKWAERKNADRLIGALTVKDQSVRLAAIKALGTITSEKGMHALISQMKDPDALIRASVAEALGAMGNARSLEFVIQLLNNDPEEAVRETAKTAVAKIKSNVRKSEE